MRFSPLAFALFAALTVSVSSAAPVPAVLSPSTLLYDGSASPTAQGWTRQHIGGTETTGAGTTRFTTTTAPAALTSEMNIYQYPVASANFIASIRLQVNSVSPHNTLDAGAMLSVSDNFVLPFGNSINRSSMLYLDPASIGWTDDSAAAVPVATTGGFHEYVIRYENGQMDVYVDAPYADVISGAAVPVLSRTLLTSNTSSATITFGDQTNDPNVDSDFVVDYVKFQNLNPPAATASIPTLSEWSLVGLALVLALVGMWTIQASRRRAWH